MVYFCSWGPGCERFHDTADTVIAEDQVGQGLFVGPNPNDTIMTTCHDETLEGALDYFLFAAYPTDGFASDSDYWIAMSIDNPAWGERMARYVERSNFKA
jgi:hypothetical protein